MPTSTTDRTAHPVDRHRKRRDGWVVVLEAVAHPLGEAAGTGLEQTLLRGLRPSRRQRRPVCSLP